MIALSPNQLNPVHPCKDMTATVTPHPSTALPNLRVLELASLTPGPYCGKLLASLGVEVIKSKPPAGDPYRRRGPFPGDVPHPERSGLYRYLNTGKQSVTLNLENPAGQDLLRQLVASQANGKWYNHRRRCLPGD